MMGETYEEIKAECISKGVSIRQLSKKAGVSLKTVEGWKSADPRSLETYRKLKMALAEIQPESPANA